MNQVDKKIILWYLHKQWFQVKEVNHYNSHPKKNQYKKENKAKGNLLLNKSL